MPGEFAAFRIYIEGTEEALNKLQQKRRAVLAAMYDSLLASSVRIRGAVVSVFGKPGYPRRQSGRLSRGVRSEAERTEVGARAVVGVEAKVPYARIIEFGGIQPARVIVPRRKKALRWTSGVTRLASTAAMDFGLTRKQAFGPPRTRSGRAGERSDTHFAQRVFQKARTQRAIPYLGPTFKSERGDVEKDLRSRLVIALSS